jgi:preprotein translocase subunit SecD
LNQAAIVINGVVVTAPGVNETITGGQLQITGPFSQEEAQALADSLGA